MQIGALMNGPQDAGAGHVRGEGAREKRAKEKAQVRRTRAFGEQLLQNAFGRKAHATEVSSIKLELTILSVSSRLIKDRAHSDERAIGGVQRDQNRLGSVRIL